MASSELDGISGPPGHRIFSRFRAGWLALTIALALHALVLMLLFAAGYRVGHQSGPALPITAEVAADDIEISLEDFSPAPAVTITPPAVMAKSITPAITQSSTQPKAASVPTPTHVAEAPSRNMGKARRSPTVPTGSPPCRRIVFVMDRSFSMGLSGALVPAQRAVIARLEALDARTQFQVVLYNRLAIPLWIPGTGGLVAPTHPNLAAAVNFVAAAQAEGQTDHCAALKMALRFEPEGIIWLTDADDFTDDQVRDIVRYNRAQIPIQVVAFTPEGGGRANSALMALANLNGGSFQALAVTGDR